MRGSKEPPLKISGDADRYDPLEGQGVDDFAQAGDLFRLMTPEQQNRLMDALAGAMTDIPQEIARRQIRHFAKADPAYGEGVAQRLGIRPS